MYSLFNSIQITAINCFQCLDKTPFRLELLRSIRLNKSSNSSKRHKKGSVHKRVINYSFIIFQPLCPPLSGFAKISYMYGIIKAENADAVSLTTWIISITTNLCKYRNTILRFLLQIHSAMVR